MGALEAQLGFNPQERSLELREIMESWLSFSAKDRKNRFTRLERHDQEELFLFLSAADQLELLEWIPILDQRTWLRLLAPGKFQERSRVKPYATRVLNTSI